MAKQVNVNGVIYNSLGSLYNAWKDGIINTNDAYAAITNWWNNDPTEITNTWESWQSVGQPASGVDDDTSNPSMGTVSPANGTDTDNGDATTSIVGSNNNQGGSTMATDWSDWIRPDVFGEYTPEQQYTALMQQALPNYYTPRYSQMASRQFNPTFGRYLLGGYGAEGSTGTGLGTGRGFSDWFTGQGSTPMTAGVPTAANRNDISGGYNLAREFGTAGVGSDAWDTLAAQNAGMAYAMQDPEAVQAMALSRYYGGGGPAGGYVGRAIQNTLSNLYGRYANTGALAGNTSPAGFLNYLGGLSGSRFGAIT